MLFGSKILDTLTISLYQKLGHPSAGVDTFSIKPRPQFSFCIVLLPKDYNTRMKQYISSVGDANHVSKKRQVFKRAKKLSNTFYIEDITKCLLGDITFLVLIKGI